MAVFGAGSRLYDQENASGRFVGTELLIRTELYKDQPCESTREPYVFVPVIGYYECTHTVAH